MDLIDRQVVKEQMIKYGFHAPDMTVTEFVEDLSPVDAVPIPKDVTNGDVIKTLFPNTKVRIYDAESDFIEYTLDGIVGNTVEKKWWDAKYKGDRI